MKKYLLFFAYLFSTSIFSADLQRLETLFIEHYFNYFDERFCGMNVKNFITDAHQKNIDIKNSFVLKVEASGFLQTLSLYSRDKLNTLHNLGNFHYMFIADNYVFDFHLGEPRVLDLHSYFRLQFTPPTDDYRVYNVLVSSKDFYSWSATYYDPFLMVHGDETPYYEGTLNELVDPEALMLINRNQLLESLKTY